MFLNHAYHSGLVKAMQVRSETHKGTDDRVHPPSQPQGAYLVSKVKTKDMEFGFSFIATHCKVKRFTEI